MTRPLPLQPWIHWIGPKVSGAQPQLVFSDLVHYRLAEGGPSS
jgi:hypothetical protein